MKKTVAIIGALDTKCEDILFMRRGFMLAGCNVLLIDTSILKHSLQQSDVTAREIVAAAGERLSTLRKTRDRGAAIAALCSGISVIVRKLLEEKRIHGVIGIGGGAGTSVGTAAMRALPVGFPKIMITTMASGVTRGYVGDKDIIMFPSIVDISGVNVISSRIYTNAVGAMNGMLKMEYALRRQGKTLALSMFGNTTPVVERCKQQVMCRGYEALVFHANGIGGQSMESLIMDGVIDGVLDITTTELADELAGGDASAGSMRLEAAGNRGLPQVIVPGCMDMVNFCTASIRRRRFTGRKIHQWNPDALLMRTTPEENNKIGKIIARKVNASLGRTTIVLPLKGLSMLDVPGGEFWWPEADRALFDGIKNNVGPHIKVMELDCHINDTRFANILVREFFKLIVN